MCLPYHDSWVVVKEDQQLLIDSMREAWFNVFSTEMNLNIKWSLTMNGKPNEEKEDELQDLVNDLKFQLSCHQSKFNWNYFQSKVKEAKELHNVLFPIKLRSS